MSPDPPSPPACPSDPEASTILAFVADFLGIGGLGPDDGLFSSGRLASLELMQLLVFLEERWEVVFDSGEITRERFGTARAIATEVRRRRDR